MEADEAKAILARLFNGGVIRRIPKRNEDMMLLLAMGAASLDPQGSYSEAELNEHLIEWLRGFTCEVGLDHVTFRRYLVDYHFLHRDESGHRYTVNGTVVATYIKPDTRSLQPREILAEVASARAARKRERA